MQMDRVTLIVITKHDGFSRLHFTRLESLSISRHFQIKSSNERNAATNKSKAEQREDHKQANLKNCGLRFVDSVVRFNDRWRFGWL